MVQSMFIAAVTSKVAAVLMTGVPFILLALERETEGD